MGARNDPPQHLPAVEGGQNSSPLAGGGGVWWGGGSGLDLSLFYWLFSFSDWGPWPEGEGRAVQCLEPLVWGSPLWSGPATGKGS